MKNKIWLFIFLIISPFIFGQKTLSKIDSINSEEAAEKLVNSIDKNYGQFKIKSIKKFEPLFGMNDYCKSIADSLRITESFYKSDFDKNGFTDMLVIGDYSFFSILIIMNFGNDSLALTRLTRRSFQECAFPKILNDTMIQYYYITDPDWQTKQPSYLAQKDMVFKFGDFVEYNRNPKIYNIEKIEYQTTMCFGTCPQFFISIDKNRDGLFKAQAYNFKSEPPRNGKKKPKEVEGVFTTLINEDTYLEIINLLNYIDFPGLKDNYAVRWTDDQACTLKITYNNGQVKTIKDYGLLGTYGLDRLYQLFFDLRFTQNWKPTK